MTDMTEVLIDTPLVPDPDADEELGPAEAEAIADEDLQGSRFLLTKLAVEPFKMEGQDGGIVEFLCNFHPAYGARFQYANITLRLKTPEGIKIIDLAPRTVIEDKPVSCTIDDKGKLGLNYNKVAEAQATTEIKKAFVVYICTVQGSGIGTKLARWDFRENPHTHNGLGSEHPLVLTLSTTGKVAGSINVNARLIRPGISGYLTAIRDMILGPEQHSYDIEFDIPEIPSSKDLFHFLHLPFSV
jgi:hypothetical protein